MDQNSTNESNDVKKPKKAKGRKMKWFIIIFMILFVMVIGAGLGFVTATLNSMPSLKGEIRPAASSQIFDVNGKTIATVHSVENRLPVSINKIPRDLQNAFIAAEDVRFYQHMGLDPKGILRAVWSNFTDQGISEGGSTITQQLARNALLSQEQTFKRKLHEAVLSLQIEKQYTKTEILEMYMNQIYFGQGAYGVQAAAQVYFSKNVEDLNTAECAMLAGIPKSPNYYSPSTNLKAAKERQEVVLEQMVKYGYLDRGTASTAKTTEIKVSSAQTKTDTNTASYFIDYVVQQLIEKYGADSVYKDGLKVYTSLDLDMQAAAEKALNQLPTYRTDSNGLKQPQGALVSIDPHSGYIKAMVGGRGNDQFNRAVLAERQPGSAFKPFVYLAALEAGMSPNTLLEDSPVTYGSWSPVNYDRRFRGKVTMRSALENSLNVPTVKLANQVTPDKTIYYAQQMGITTLVTNGAVNDRNLASSLGGLTRGVTPLQLASAYGVLANQGVRVDPVAIIKVVDRNGKVLEQYTPKGRSVISEKTAYILTDIMRGVISHGTGAGANIGRPAAGKTGTTSDYVDAWFVGFTPDLVTAVWMGQDNNAVLSSDITGGTIPASIWRSYMSAVLANVPVRDFVRPSGVSIEERIADPGEEKDKDKDKDKQGKPGETSGTTGTNQGDKTVPPPPNKPDKPAPPTTPPPPNKPNTKSSN